MKFFINHKYDPACNLALEELLCNDFPEPFLMLWQNDRSVIVGRNQNTFAEVNGAFLSAENIPVVRRMTGGGAVYHDLGNVNYTLLICERHPGADSFARFARPVVECLRKMGAAAEFSGRNDILVEGRKVSGSAQRSLRDRTLFHGTLLFDANMEMLGKVLTPGRAKIESKGVKSVKSRVANLKEFLPHSNVGEFIEQLQKHLCPENEHFEPVPQEWCDRAEKLADMRYRTWEWNWGIPFDAAWEKSARFPGTGIVELKVKLVNARVESLKITGDFFGESAPVEERLKGVLFNRKAIEEQLAGFALEKYILGLKTQDFLSLIDV